MAFNPMFNQFTPQTTGMQIGNMQGIFGPGTLFANRNNPSRGSAFDGSNNRFQDQLNFLNDKFGSKGPIDTSGRTRKQTNKPKTIPEVIKDVFGGGDKPKDGKDDGTYGGFTFEEIKKLQQMGFDQQNKLFQQGLAMQGFDKIAQGIQAGPKAYVEKVIPQMFAGNAALLSAGAADNRSLANIMAQPYRQLQRMNFYS